MTETTLRIRAFLDRNFELVAILLLVLVLLGGWVTYSTHVAPATTPEERTVSQWRTTGTFTHNATVVRETQVYPEGTVLENQRTYFTSISPVLNGVYRFSYDANDSSSLDVTAAAHLVVRSVGQQPDTNTTYWQYSRALGASNATDVPPSTAVAVPFTVDVPAVDNRTDEIRTELGASAGQIETFVDVTVAVTGEVDGRSVERTMQYRLPIRLQSGVYQVERTDPKTTDHRTTRTVQVPATYGPLRSLGAPVLFLVSLVSFVALVLADQRSYLSTSAAAREYLAFVDDRADFEEWITAIRLPDEALDGPKAEAESLHDLVDFAIDTDNAVIEDAARNAYFVFHEDVRYCYQPPEPVTDGAIDDRDDGNGDGDVADD